jgi:hypothetical protein
MNSPLIARINCEVDTPVSTTREIHAGSAVRPGYRGHRRCEHRARRRALRGCVQVRPSQQSTHAMSCPPPPLPRSLGRGTQVIVVELVPRHVKYVQLGASDSRYDACSPRVTASKISACGRSIDRRRCAPNAPLEVLRHIRSHECNMGPWRRSRSQGGAGQSKDGEDAAQ